MFSKFRFWIIYRLMKGGENMILVCTTLITYHQITFAQVPASMQDAVKANLLAMGLDENGNPIVTTPVV